jgi:predicted PurR-regulated permease PerM
MANARVAPQWQRSIVLLSGTVISVVAVSVLYWAQSIFIPVALAIFLTFLLHPVVSRLRLRGLNRTPAVILTVSTAALLLGVACWIVTVQISSLLHELPEHTETVKAKVKSLKTLVQGSGRFARMVEEINSEIKGVPAPSHAAQSHATPDPADPALAPAQPRAVIIEPQTPIWLSRITSFLSPLMECLAELALSIVLVVFMLQKREEFRNRVIRLVGDGRIAPATKFVDEAGQRISRFLLMQALVNGTFGLILAFGLLALGVKYAFLWGFLGAMLRYLPYIGPYFAAVLPLSTSLALNDGWATTLMVIGLFLTLELVIANAVEPWLYGQSMGVSEVALLVSAAFWAFLWGPVGLVLSSPLTVCLVMLGRYVPQLEFLAVLMGDEPALEPKDCFYQRLLARDQDEAEELILERLKTEPADEIFDTMLVPALCATRQSMIRGEITEADERAIMHSLGEIVEDLGDMLARPGKSGADLPAGEPLEAAHAQTPCAFFGCPARDSADQVALQMFEKTLDPSRWQMKLIAPETLTSELLELVDAQEPSLVCIASLPPGGLAHTRYLCKRLSARFPDLRIVVGRWGEEPGADEHGKALEEAGASSTAATLLETRQQLEALRPLLDSSRPDPAVAQPATARTAGKSASGTSRSPLHRAAAKEQAARTASP